MTRVAIQDTITRPATGIAVPSATITIREGALNTGPLATIYTTRDGPTEANNPINTGDVGFTIDGELSVFADTGVYYVTVNTAGVVRSYVLDLISSVEAKVVIDGGYVYANRAAWLAASIPAPVIRATWIDGEESLNVVRKTGGPLAQTNGQEWAPEGAVHPEHWAHNATPGTTDMASAIQSAFNYGFAPLNVDGPIGGEPYTVVDFFNRDYYVGSTIKWTGREDYAWARGNGARLVTDIDDAIFQIGADVMFSGGDTTGEVNNYSGIISGFVFNNTNVSSANSVAIRGALNGGMVVRLNVFVDFWVAIDGHRWTGRTISDNWFMLSASRTIPAKAFIRLQGVYSSTNTYTPGGGIHCEGNEFWGSASNPALLEHCILIHCVDGFYHASNHYISYDEDAIKLEPQGSFSNSRNNVIIDVISGGANYFDNPNTGSRSVSIGGTIAFAGTAGQANGQYKNVSFNSGDYFRGNIVARNGIFVSVTDGGGFSANRGGLHGFNVSACRFDGFSNVPIEVQGSTLGKVECVGILINGNQFRENNAGSNTNSGISLDVKSASIVNNIFGKEINNPQRCISVNVATGADGSSLTIANNDFTESGYTVEPYLVSKDAFTTTQIGPNITNQGAIYDSTIDIRAVNSPAINLRARDSSAISDMVFRSNGVIGSETSLNVTMESGGFFRVMANADDAETGLAGSNEVFRVTDVGATVTGIINGTAVQSSATDTTAEKLLKVGAAGVALGADVYRRGNILGTVLQASGVPTGALIESGNNANGDYVRFANGTQICWSQRVTNAAWTYPAAFAGTVITSVNFASNSPRFTATSDHSPTGCTPRSFDTSGTATTQTVYCMAIGKWF